MTEVSLGKRLPSRLGLPISQSLLRALLFQPEHALDLSRRGVILRDPVRANALRAVGKNFLAGYNGMLLADPFDRVQASLAETEPEQRGFVVEGAAMGASMRDALSLRGGLLETLLSLHGASFEYMIAVGAGWAIARVPWRIKRVSAALDPLLFSLAYDGQGFHDLYFHPLKAEAGRAGRYSGWRARSYDAGVGRALWFIASGDVPRVATLVERFPYERRPDLLAGVGLAMAYAGPATAEDWDVLRAHHPNNRLDIAQGICFAAEAMRRASVFPIHTDLACKALGLSFEQAAMIAVSSRPAEVSRSGSGFAYQAWRAEIRHRLYREGV